MTLIQPDAPHPHSYRPDLPLRSELNDKGGFDEGYEKGYERGKQKVDFQIRNQLTEAREEIRQLRLRLNAIGSPEK